MANHLPSPEPVVYAGPDLKSKNSINYSNFFYARCIENFGIQLVWSVTHLLRIRCLTKFNEQIWLEYF